MPQAIAKYVYLMNSQADDSPSAPPETVYTPDGLRQLGSRIWIVMAWQLWASRELIWRLIYRDISVRYRQSFLGYLWAIIPAAITVVIFAYLTEQRVLPIGRLALPYPVFALWSLTVWQLFAGVLSAATYSLVGAGALVTKINFPKEALVVASVGSPLFDFLIRLLPVAAVFAWYGVIPPWQALWLPLILLPLLLMALGLGFFLAVLNLAVRDIGNVVGTLLTFGMFAAPVFYPPPVTFPFYLVNVLNPFSPLLIATQDLLAHGALQHDGLFAGAVAFALLVFLLGWRLFYMTMPRVAERA